jgi:hypothetical protein
VPKPEVASFTPAGGGSGTDVRIVGTSFNTATFVAFGSKPAVSFTVESDTVIHAIAPDSVQTANLVVLSPTGSGSSPDLFVAPPMIAAFAPSRARVGQTVHLTGFNLAAPTGVTIAGLAASFHSLSAQALDAVVPGGAGDGHVIVTNAGGADTAAAMFELGTPVEAGINLSWDDCGQAGNVLKTWTCDTNSGASFTLVASFVPPTGIASFTGVTGELRMAAQGALPDWWKHGSGYCRGTSAIQASADFTAGPSTCVDPFAGAASGGFTYQLQPDPNRVRLQVQYGLPVQDAATLDPANEYYAFRVSVARAKSTGSGSCAACLTPVCITLNEMRLVQENDPDVSLTLPLVRNSAFWQSQQNACLALTPALVSLVKSEASAEAARLEWELARGDAAMLYRRERAGEWRRLDRVTPNSERRIEYVDRDVKPGVTYEYRLGIVIQGEEIFAGETSLTIPSRPVRLALSGITWSPQGVRALVNLATDDPATLEIFDLGGRRHATHRIEGLKAGEHEVQVSTSLQSGVYFGRLVQGRQSATARLSVVN